MEGPLHFQITCLRRANHFQIFKFSNYLPFIARKSGQNKDSAQAGVGFADGHLIGRGDDDRLGCI